MSVEARTYLVTCCPFGRVAKLRSSAHRFLARRADVIHTLTFPPSFPYAKILVKVRALECIYRRVRKYYPEALHAKVSWRSTNHARTKKWSKSKTLRMFQTSPIHVEKYRVSTKQTDSSVMTRKREKTKFTVSRQTASKSINLKEVSRNFPLLNGMSQKKYFENQ